MPEPTSPRPARTTSWETRLEQLAGVIEATGSLPRRTTHHALTGWMYDQYARMTAGILSPEKTAAFTAAAPGFAPRRYSRDRIADLEDFWNTRQRLPRRSSGDPAERSLAVFLVMDLRSRIREGRISPDHLARVRQIPGAAVIRSVPDQGEMLEALRRHVEQHAMMPAADGTAETGRLVRWVSNNTKGDPASKSPALRERHLEIDRLRSLTRTRAQLRVLEQLGAAEKFCAEHGYRPVSGKDATGAERALADWLGRSIGAGPSSMPDDISARRLQALAAVPSRSDVRWKENLRSLKDYTERTGALPTAWSQENFSWLTVQRREYGAGNMPAWKESALAEVPGAINIRRRAA